MDERECNVTNGWWLTSTLSTFSLSGTSFTPPSNPKDDYQHLKMFSHQSIHPNQTNAMSDVQKRKLRPARKQVKVGDVDLTEKVQPGKEYSACRPPSLPPSPTPLSSFRHEHLS